MYKLINEYRVEPSPKNGFIEVEGKIVGISNLPKYLKENPDVAAANGYYGLVDSDYPEYDVETQYVEQKYVIEDNSIKIQYEVNDIVMPEVIFDENTEHTESED